MKKINSAGSYFSITKILVKYIDRNDFDETTDSSEGDKVSYDAKKFVEELENLGPTFIKFGQMLSTRQELLPNIFIKELKKLNSNTDPVPFEDINHVFVDEMGIEISDLYESFEETPLAAASLGQVYRAKLRSGEDVVVKIQKPGVRSIINKDLDFIGKMIDYSQQFSKDFKSFGPTKILDEFKKSLLRELNYKEEANNLKVITENLKDFKNIKFPRLYEAHSSSRVLTMEFIKGSHFSTFSKLSLIEVDGESISKDILKAYLKQIFVDGFFHSDPHLGNIISMGERQIGIIDLGMVTKLGPQLRNELLILIIAISEGKGSKASEIAYRMCSSQKGKDVDIQEFKQKLSRLVKDEFGRSFEEMRCGAIFFEMMKIGSEAGLNFPQELSSMARVLIYLDELIQILAPSLDPTEIIRKNSVKLIKSNFEENTSMTDFYFKAIEAKEVVEKVPVNINRALDQLVNNKIKVTVDAINEDKIILGAQKIANRITSGLVIAALIIGAALLMNVKTSFTLVGYPGFAIILFILASIGGLIILSSIYFKDE